MQTSKHLHFACKSENLFIQTWQSVVGGDQTHVKPTHKMPNFVSHLPHNDKHLLFLYHLSLTQSTYTPPPWLPLPNTRMVQPGNSVATSWQRSISPPGCTTTHRVGSGEAFCTQLPPNFWKQETHCVLA